MEHNERNPSSRSESPTLSSVAAVEAVVSLLSATSVVADGTEYDSILAELLQQKGPVLYKNDVDPETPKSSPLSSYDAVKNECKRALTLWRRGNHKKSLKLMKELSCEYENCSALVYRVQGTVFAKVASIIDDPMLKQQHLKNAIESARKAVTLSPNSIEFAHFYATLLYEAANEAKDYEEVIVECERALAIENPIDPAKESLLQDESQHKLSPADVRIADVRSELRSLIQKSNLATISVWMKTLGSGDDKFRLIPPISRRLPPHEDPTETRLVQDRRPDEINKATKTPEVLRNGGRSFLNSCRRKEQH